MLVCVCGRNTAVLKADVGKNMDYSRDIGGKLLIKPLQQSSMCVYGGATFGPLKIGFCST